MRSLFRNARHRLTLQVQTCSRLRIRLFAISFIASLRDVRFVGSTSVRDFTIIILSREQSLLYFTESFYSFRHHTLHRALSKPSTDQSLIVFNPCLPALCGVLAGGAAPPPCILRTRVLYSTISCNDMYAKSLLRHAHALLATGPSSAAGPLCRGREPAMARPASAVPSARREDI